MTVTATVYIDGVRVPDGTAGEDPDAAAAVDELRVTWGRTTTLDQPPPSTCTLTLWALNRDAITATFGGLVRLGSRVAVITSAGGVVFLGSVTSVSGTWDQARGGVDVAVIADDVLADLGQRRVGADPWPAETLAARVNHVMTASRRDVTVTVDPDIAPTPLCKQDIDVRTAADVLGQIAASVDSVLWPTVTGTSSPAPALWIESPANRVPLRRLALVDGWIVIVDVSTPAGAIQLDGCVPDRDPVSFTEAIDDVVTGVSVTYYIPDPSDPTLPNLGVTVDAVDAVAEDPAGGWGIRRVTLDSLLSTSADALATGNRILARLRPPPSWRIPGVAFQASDTTDTNVATLLSAATRHGRPVILPLPDWAPFDVLSGYLEGGVYTYSRGEWRLELLLSDSQGYGAAATRYQDLPATWYYNQTSPDITYDDLVGVGPPTGA